MVGGGRPLQPEILGQPAPVGAKSPSVSAVGVFAACERIHMDRYELNTGVVGSRC